MCPGPAYMENEIAFFSDEDDIEIETCLALETRKILGVVTASTQLPPVRFFMEEEEEYSQDPTTTATITEIEEIAFERNSDLSSDDELEQRLDALNFLANNVSVRRSEEEQPQYLKKLIIITEQPLSTCDLEYYAQVTDLNKP
jgi:hypothetical protein